MDQDDLPPAGEQRTDDDASFGGSLGTSFGWILMMVLVFAVIGGLAWFVVHLSG